MSCNISHAEYKSGKLHIKARDAKKLERDDNKCRFLPEINFLENDHFQKLLDKADDDDVLPIDDFWWSGEFSGHAYYESLEKVIAMTTGKAIILFTWPEEMSAIKVNNGKMKEGTIRIEVD